MKQKALFLASFICVCSPLAAHAEASSTLEKRVIVSSKAPAAGGAYSQGIRVGNLVFLAGQLAVDPATQQLIKDTDIEEQTRRALENLRAVLEADALTMDHVVSTTVYMKDIGEFARMNKVYSTFFKAAPPARATVEVARLPRDA